MVITPPTKGFKTQCPSLGQTIEKGGTKAGAHSSKDLVFLEYESSGPEEQVR